MVRLTNLTCIFDATYFGGCFAGRKREEIQRYLSQNGKLCTHITEKFYTTVKRVAKLKWSWCASYWVKWITNLNWWFMQVTKAFVDNGGRRTSAHRGSWHKWGWRPFKLKVAQLLEDLRLKTKRGKDGFYCCRLLLEASLACLWQTSCNFVVL